MLVEVTFLKLPKFGGKRVFFFNFKAFLVKFLYKASQISLFLIAFSGKRVL